MRDRWDRGRLIGRKANEPCHQGAARPGQGDDQHKQQTELRFCGIDWAERHHDIALIGQDGSLIAKAA
ncbi:hypothetical protein ACQPZQ_41370 [Pseudonocardia sp. CA-142604]|uniref:hypothetical protein n=1 Tax=Pseudonocardia sp. CA-142604 TaxID=3240024 RepID=UPI003D8CC79C